MESKIKTVDDAFKYLGLDPTLLPDVSALTKEDQKDVINNFKLKKVVKAINKEFNNGVEWEPNWNDHRQSKYSPWPDVDASDEQPGGFGLSRPCYGRWYASAGVGSRLSFVSREACEYAFEQFKDLYIQELLIIK